jgi:regulatory protein
MGATRRPIITKIRVDKRAPHLVVVEVDGARFASIPAEGVRALSLEKGMELDGALRERIEYMADVEASRRVALRMLAARPLAVNALLRRLRDRGHNPSAVAEVVGQLEAQGLLDDREYARHFARVRSPRGHGRARLIHDLLARGVDRRVAELGVDEVLAAEGVDTLAQARALAERKVRQLTKLSAEHQRRRLIVYLGRRGFRGYEVRRIVDQVISNRS